MPSLTKMDFTESLTGPSHGPFDALINATPPLAFLGAELAACFTQDDATSLAVSLHLYMLYDDMA